MLLCGTNDEKLKIEQLSQWKLEAEFRNICLASKLDGHFFCLSHSHRGPWIENPLRNSDGWVFKILANGRNVMITWRSDTGGS